MCVCVCALRDVEQDESRSAAHSGLQHLLRSERGRGGGDVGNQERTNIHSARQISSTGLKKNIPKVCE